MGKPTKAQIEEDIRKGRRNKQGELYPSMRKKPGKKAKRGKKVTVTKKKDIKVVKPPKPITYKIIETTERKEYGSNKFKFTSYNDALTKMKELKETSSLVRFPSMYSSRFSVRKERLLETLLLKEKEPDDTASFLKDEYGKNVEHIIEDDEVNWTIIDKFKRRIEETFWVFGYDKKKERKDFEFILNEILLYNIEDKYFIKYIIVYNNKLVIKYIDNDCDLVICKCHEDVIRLYTELQTEIKKTKVKNVIFNGVTKKEPKVVPETVIQNDLEQIIMNKTGWDLKVVRRNKTSPR